MYGLLLKIKVGISLIPNLPQFDHSSADHNSDYLSVTQVRGKLWKAQQATELQLLLQATPIPVRRENREREVIRVAEGVGHQEEVETQGLVDEKAVAEVALGDREEEDLGGRNRPIECHHNRRMEIDQTRCRSKKYKSQHKQLARTKTQMSSFASFAHRQSFTALYHHVITALAIFAL